MNSLTAFLRDIIGFVAFVIRRWQEDRCPQIAGALTFTTLLAIVPLLTVAVAVLSALPFFEGAMVQVKIFLLMNLVPEIAGRIITVYMGQFAEAAGRLTTVSLVALLATAIATLFTVDRSLNVIWRVDRHRPLWLSVAGYLALLVLGPILLGLSLWATSWLVAASLDRLSMPSGLEAAVLRVVPVAVSAALFFLLYRIIPNRHVPASHALAGGILAAVVFELMKSVFATYVRAMPTYQLVYGAFASIPIFLVWLYLSWLVVLLGAEFTACLSWWRGPRGLHEDARAEEDRAAFRVGRVLAAAGGAPVALASLREAAGLPDDRMEDLLERLARTGALRREGAGWVACLPGEPPGA